MTPTTPVLPSQPAMKAYEIVFAKDQPQYQPLPAIRCLDGRIVTRWTLTWRERLRLIFGGNIYLQQLTFGEALQPQLPSVKEPILELVAQ